MDYTIPSANTERYRHWAVVRKNTLAAKEAWLSALRSPSQATALEGLTKIIALPGVNPYAIPSPEASESTTPIQGQSGNIEPS